MSIPKRIQRKRTKGWRMPEGAVYVGRPSRWGNPWTIERDGAFMTTPLYRIVADPTIPPAFYGGERDRDDALREIVQRYRKWITGSQSRIADLTPQLAGRDLVCWCPLDQPCHADVLLEIANGGAA